MKVTSVKESLTSFTNLSTSFMTQLLFMLSPICPRVSSHSFYLCYQQLSFTEWVFAAHTIHKFLWKKMHLPKCSFCCWEVEVMHKFFWSRFESGFQSHQSITLDDMLEGVLKEAVICHGNEEHTVVY